MNGGALTLLEDARAPDGAYITLILSGGEDVHFDFFLADGGNEVREVRPGRGEQLYRLTYPDDTVKTSAIMREWYSALAAAQGMDPAGGE
ncbi:MAG: hypothetical protein IJ221_04485 [Oscillibacter sp.]|nr:hypothetical protein [Oscillibacter sp.]